MKCCQSSRYTAAERNKQLRCSEMFCSLLYLSTVVSNNLGSKPFVTMSASFIRTFKSSLSGFAVELIVYQKNCKERFMGGEGM